MSPEDSDKNLKTNFILNLYRGNISLVKTFWIYCFTIVTLLFSWLYGIIEETYFNIAPPSRSEISVTFIYILMTICSFFIFISVWRSSRKYTGRNSWSMMARLYVVFMIIAYVGIFSVHAFREDNFISIVKYEVEIEKEKLPRMINDEIRLDNVFLENNIITYEATYIDLTFEEIDFSSPEFRSFESSMTSILKRNICGTEKILKLLKNDIEVGYVYRAKKGKQIFNIKFNKKDCSATEFE